MTQRDQAEHDVPWAGQPYSVKRHGLTIDNCDSEPVQTPGCIQAHGALLVLRPADFTVAQASENTSAVLGRPARDLLGQPFSAVAGEQAQALLVESLRTDPATNNPLYLCTVPQQGDRAALDVTVHVGGRGDVIVEFEPVRDAPGTEPDYYAMVKKTVTRLQTATNLLEFCTLVTQGVRALTGLDRVMVYRFHADGHGEVYAESHREGLSPWLGMHYPAADIPEPARAIFRQTWIRPVPDIDEQLAELVPLVHPDSARPLDMTYCTLRGPSVMYIEYLRNMGVRASLTLSLRRGESLWGLIAGHHYSGPAHFSYQARAACEFLAQVVSLLHKAAEDRAFSDYRLRMDTVHQELVAQAAQEGGLVAMTDGSPTLLDGMDAGGAALYHRDRWWRVGRTPSPAQLEALGSWLNQLPEFDLPQPAYQTDRLSEAFAPAQAYADIASGVLAVPLARSRRNMLVWFRPETIQSVSWGGDPADKPMTPGPHGPRLTPRRSFELFVESVRARSLPWTSAEVSAAQRLRMLVMELVVNRAEQLAALNDDLRRSNEELDAFAYIASHDLKEPLRGIHKYAHQLLTLASQEPEQQRRLEGLVRLTLRMDSLLDSLLHFSRVGRVVLELEETDLGEVLGEALEMVDARRLESRTDISMARPLPTVRCDRMRVREVFVNLLSNAIKYNDKPVGRIEVSFLHSHEAQAQPWWTEAVRGQRVYYVRDNGIGIAEQHTDQIFKMFKRLHGREEYGGGAGAGLAIVRKLVQRHGGDIWVQSRPGEGSTFFFTIPGDEIPRYATP